MHHSLRTYSLQDCAMEFLQRTEERLDETKNVLDGQLQIAQRRCEQRRLASGSSSKWRKRSSRGHQIPNKLSTSQTFRIRVRSACVGQGVTKEHQRARLHWLAVEKSRVQHEG